MVADGGPGHPIALDARVEPAAAVTHHVMKDQDDMPESTPALHPDRNLALELARVPEAAAMATGRWAGRGERDHGRTAAPPHPCEV